MLQHHAVNIGAMMNRGLDITVSTRGNFNQDWRYELQVNGGWLKNDDQLFGPLPDLTSLSTQASGVSSQSGMPQVKHFLLSLVIKFRYLPKPGGCE
jgi:hypothetical protein